MVTYSHYLYAETGLSSGFQGLYVSALGGNWIYPTPEDGNEMFINLDYGYFSYECPLYCEKSGIFSEPFWEYLVVTYDKNFLKLQGVS